MRNRKGFLKAEQELMLLSLETRQGVQITVTVVQHLLQRC